MANHNKDSNLVDEKEALSMFFTSLLTDTENDLVQNKEKSENATVFLPEIPIDVSDDIVVQQETSTIEVIEPIESIEEELVSTIVEPEPKVIEGNFQIMMFKTAGLTLAVPLVELSGVITWPESLTEMPGHKNSYLGIVQHLGKKVPVIDIAQIVFPQDRISSLVKDSSERLQRIVFINDFEWGLACDAVDEVITIDADEIKWRKFGTKRAWLAGTVVEHMCALLDTKELSKLLNSDNK